MIKGRSARLRFLEDNDIPIVVKYFTDDGLMKYYCRSANFSAYEICDEWKSKIRSNDRIDFIIETKDGVPIGMSIINRIDWVNRNAHLHVLIGERSHQKGLIGCESAFLTLTYAFHTLNLHKVYAFLMSFSKSITNLANWANFKLEATLPETIYLEGRFHDINIFGILDTDFNQLINSNEGKRYIYFLNKRHHHN